MIKSMTGYGKGEAATKGGRIVVEIRSVNHRYGEISVKLPRVLLALEAEVKKGVSDRLKRGKIEVFVQLEESVDAASVPVVNLPLARAYLDAFTTLKETLGLTEPVTLGMVAAQRDVVTTGAREEGELPAEALLAAVTAAVGRLEEMRSREGEALRVDLVQRRAFLAETIDAISARAPQSVADNAARLRERLSQLLAETPLDEARLAQEVAVLADRTDITEELVRFASHLTQFDRTLELAEPVGRKLDFLLQELNREVNTIGSKSADSQITALVVALKAELEKIREQVQNIE